MVLLELFSGIGGFSMGLQAAGYSFEKVFFSEIEKHAIANFKYNFPYAEHIGSVTDIAKVSIARPDMAKVCKDGKAALSAMPLKLSDGSDLTFLSGRTLRACSSQDIAGIFGALSRPLPTLGVIDSNGNCLIRHGFYPKTGKGYTLSDVLQKNVPQVYFLSIRRVEGLLRSIMMHPLFVLSEQ